MKFSDYIANINESNMFPDEELDSQAFKIQRLIDGIGEKYDLHVIVREWIPGSRFQSLKCLIKPTRKKTVGVIAKWSKTFELSEHVTIFSDPFPRNKDGYIDCGYKDIPLYTKQFENELKDIQAFGKEVSNMLKSGKYLEH